MTSARQCSAHVADFAQFCPFTGLLLVGVAWCSPCTDTSPGRAGGKSGEFTKEVRDPVAGDRGWTAARCMDDRCGQECVPLPLYLRSRNKSPPLSAGFVVTFRGVTACARRRPPWRRSFNSSRIPGHPGRRQTVTGVSGAWAHRPLPRNPRARKQMTLQPTDTERLILSNQFRILAKL